MTFSLMGQEGTKGDFEAGCACVSMCACGRHIRSGLNASKHVFDLVLYLCFRCVLTSLQGEAFFILHCSHLLCSLSFRSV